MKQINKDEQFNNENILAHAAVGTAPNGTIRISLSWVNEMKDIELLAVIVKDILE